MLLLAKPDLSRNILFISHQAARFRFANTDTTNLTVVTKSAPDAFPSALRSKRSVVKTSLAAGEADEGAIIKEKCPQCGHDEMQYHTLQLRSADEGATVFYTCTKCHYKFRTNN